jgi:tetratricopeptide (TPR) repeat protein
MPFDYRAIGNEILNKLEIDPTRLGEALSTLNEVVRGYLESDAWDEVPAHCESARKLGDEMHGSVLSHVIDTAYAEGIFHTYEGISHLYQAEKAKEKKNPAEESEELAKAIGCLEKSQQSFHFDYRDQWNEVILRLNLGRLYRSQNRLDDALLAFQESLHIFNGLSIEKRQEIVKVVLAEIEKTRRPLKAKAQIFLSYVREDEE